MLIGWLHALQRCAILEVKNKNKRANPLRTRPLHAATQAAQLKACPTCQGMAEEHRLDYPTGGLDQCGLLFL